MPSLAVNRFTNFVLLEKKRQRKNSEEEQLTPYELFAKFFAASFESHLGEREIAAETRGGKMDISRSTETQVSNVVSLTLIHGPNIYYVLATIYYLQKRVKKRLT